MAHTLISQGMGRWTDGSVGLPGQPAQTVRPGQLDQSQRRWKVFLGIVPKAVPILHMHIYTGAHMHLHTHIHKYKKMNLYFDIMMTNIVNLTGSGIT